ncbi:MAG: tRNA cyclic N6-threonylcarbamoyladenosine(37) synthase TcdA [Pseudomonadales bacterium]
MSSYEQRFGGTARIYSAQALEVYRQCHVCVVGIGGVGSWVAEALVRSGIGEITLIDLDDICVTNTNRQVHVLSTTIGQSKVSVMAERLREINPECLVHEEHAFISADNVRELIGEHMHYVVDAIDEVPAKAALIAHCKRNKVSVVTVGGAGGQLDPTRVDVADLSRTEQDPLAAKVRSYLRRHYGFSKSGRRFAVECVYSSEQLKYPMPDGSVSAEKVTAGRAMDCSTGFGAATVVTTTFGMVAASRVLIKIQQKIAAGTW